MQIARASGAHRESHHLFFAGSLDGASVVLDRTETTHAVSVLRLQPGDTLHLTDGNGLRTAGIVETIGKHSLSVRIVSRMAVVRPAPQIHLLAGLPDRDAFEQLLLDATALGVARIIPLVAEHCRKPWWDGNWEKHAPRFHQKMVVALKQSGTCFLPRLAPPVSTALAAAEAAGTVLVADPDGIPLANLAPPDTARPVCCFIGPPGGFSDSELRLFEERSFSRVRIAHGRLRTELAATVLCAQVAGSVLGEVAK